MTILLCATLFAPLTLYVSDRGDAAGSGTAGRPFRTIAQAAEALRHEHHADDPRPAQVLLQGTFAVSQPVTFGSEASRTTFRSWNPRRPAILSGGISLREWARVPWNNGFVWAASVPPAAHYRALWVDGTQRLPIASVTGIRLTGLLGGAEKLAWNIGQDAAKFAPADIPPIAHPEEVEFVGIHRWAESRMGIRDIDRVNGILRFDRKSVFQLTDSDGFSPFRLENVPEMLGRGGDWCYDRGSGRILVVSARAPRDCVVSQCPQLVVVRGANSVIFENVTFRHTQWDPPNDSAGDGQAAISVPASLLLDQCSGAVVQDCRFEHLGTYAVEIAGNSTGTEIRRCSMTDLGGGGVKVGPGTSSTTVRDCRMVGLGRTFASAIGVWIGDSGHNVVSHNEIRDLYYTGISVGWSWGYGVSHAVENRIEFNDISDVGQGQLSDMGGIYTLGVSSGTVLRNNRISRVESRTYGAWGIYLDEGSSSILVENNLVIGTKTGSFHQHYGKDNLIRNNVFLAARTEGQLIRTRKEDHRSFTLERNVIEWRGTNLLGSNWDGPGFDIDRNVYWRTDKMPILFAGKPLAEWRALGHDLHSLIEDPRMAVTERGVEFPAGSPADRLGIHALDMSNVGVERH